jgi:hypothetical protein
MRRLRDWSGVPTACDAIDSDAELVELYRRIAELAILCQCTVHDANNAITTVLLRLEIASREQQLGAAQLAELREGFARLTHAFAELDAVTARWCRVEPTGGGHIE